MPERSAFAPITDSPGIAGPHEKNPGEITGVFLCPFLFLRVRLMFGWSEATSWRPSDPWWRRATARHEG